MYGSAIPKPPLLAVKLAAPATCTEPVEPIGPAAVSVSVPDTLVVVNCTPPALFRSTLPAVRPMMLKSVSGPLMVTLPVPTPMVAVPPTVTAPEAPRLPVGLVTLAAELAVMLRAPVIAVSPREMAPAAALPVVPFCAMLRLAAEIFPAAMVPAVPVPMVMDTVPLPALIEPVLSKTALPDARSPLIAPGSLALKTMLPLFEMTSALT